MVPVKAVQVLDCFGEAIEVRHPNELIAREQLETCKGLLPESEGQNLALTVLFFSCTLDGGIPDLLPRTYQIDPHAAGVGLNMAHIRQSRPDSGLGFQVKLLDVF